MSDSENENESDDNLIELRREEPVIQKVKKPRTQKQIEAFTRAREKKMENARLRALEKSLISENKKIQIQSRETKRQTNQKKYADLQAKHNQPQSNDEESDESEEEVIIKKKKNKVKPIAKKKKKVVIYVSSSDEDDSDSDSDEDEYDAPKSRIQRREKHYTEPNPVDYNTFFI